MGTVTTAWSPLEPPVELRPLRVIQDMTVWAAIAGIVCEVP
jgi:hypothetical protein